MWQRIKNCYHFLVTFLASLVTNFPAYKLGIIGVTGTDGKTTTVNMIYSIFKEAGYKVGAISSIGALINGEEVDTGYHVTTPSGWHLQYLLKRMVEKKCQFAVVEVTSHGLDQNRCAFIPFKVGVLTNVSHEHLDYHKSFENYLKTKAKLFERAEVSILNKDDTYFDYFKNRARSKIISYGVNDISADFSLKNFPLHLRLVGEFNYYNALAAVAVAKVFGIDEKVIKLSLEKFSGVVGRMEEVKNNLGIRIYIDFAHTPNALEQALKALKAKLKNKEQKIISVFGAAGERDKFKRPLMGEISTRLAHNTIITSEDPRSENPAKIAEEILAGCKKSGGILGKNVFIELDRNEAIKLAIKIARRGDIVGIFGKGHEKSMAYNGHEFPWSDREAVEKILSRKKI